MLRTAFKLAQRQTKGLMTLVFTLMDLTLSTPDHSTVNRRAVKLPVIQAAQVPAGPLHVLIDSTGLQVYGAGQWLEAKHSGKSRRQWRKLHLAVDTASGMIMAQTLTDQDVDDPSQIGPLPDRIDNPIDQVTADGAYDGDPTYPVFADSPILRGSAHCLSMRWTKKSSLEFISIKSLAAKGSDAPGNYATRSRFP